MSDLGERIKEGRTLAGKISQENLAQEIGVSRAAVAQWESRKVNGTNPSIENLIKISAILNVNIEWLITGAGVAAKAVSDEELYIPVGAQLAPQSLMVPVIDWEQIEEWCAGKITLKDLSNPRMIGFTPSDPMSVSKRCFAVIIPSGDESMRPDFNPGSAAICDPDFLAKHLSMVLVGLEVGQQPIIRQLIEYGRTKLFDTLNSRYPNSEFAASSKVFATVRAAVKVFD